MGAVALDSGDYEEARRLFEDVLASHRRNDNPGGIGFALLNLGQVHHGVGDHQASRRDFEEARACFVQVVMRAQAAYALIGLAAAEASEARFEEAARFLGQARRELDEAGQSAGEFAEMLTWTESRARTALGDDRFDAAFTAAFASRSYAASA